MVLLLGPAFSAAGCSSTEISPFFTPSIPAAVPALQVCLAGIGGFAGAEGRVAVLVL
jgi:hypothetical protein